MLPRPRSIWRALIPTIVMVLFTATPGWVPAVATPAAKPDQPAIQQEANDTLAVARARASRDAARLGQKVLVDDLITETTKVWALPDGKFEAIVAAGPVRAKRNGAWAEVDLNLRRRPDGTVAPGMHLADLVLSGAKPAGVKNDLATMARSGSAGARRAMRWAGRLPEPILEGAKATYVDVYPGIDIVIEVRMSGYEMFAIVKDAPALAHVDSTLADLRIATPESTLDPHGNLVHDETAMTAAPLMWDAAVDAGTGLPANRRRMDFQRTSDGFALAADRVWLNDPARRFPITIDPTEVQKNAHLGEDTWVQTGGGSDGFDDAELEIGKNGGTTKRSAYVNFDTGGMISGQDRAIVHSANIKLWGTYVVSGGACVEGQWHVYLGTGSMYRYTTWASRTFLIDYYNNPTGYQDGNGELGMYRFEPPGWSTTVSQCTGNWVNSNATLVFQHAVNRQWSSFTAAILPMLDDTNGFYKRFKAYDSGTLPHAIVNYSYAPKFVDRGTVPATAPCVLGSGRPVIGTTTPTLWARYNQSDNNGVDVHFEYGVIGEPSTVRYVGVGAGQQANYTIPPGELVDGKSYVWKTFAKSWAGVWSVPEPPCEFTVDIWAGKVPGCPGTATDKTDVNGDGVVDTLIADPLRATSSVWESGAVHVVDGQTAAMTTVDASLAEVPGDPVTSDRFGSSLAVVDMNVDGCADVVIGAPYKNIGSVSDAGEVYLLYGTPAGLGKGPAAEVLAKGTNRIAGTPNGWDNFGYALSAGRTGAGEPFLIIGTPRDDPGAGDAGTFTYIRGDHRITVQQSDFGSLVETDDRTGMALAATPYHFAVSAPGESLDSGSQFAGLVCTFKHTMAANGKPEKIGCYTQQDFGIAGREAGDMFGKSIAMAPYRKVGSPAGAIDSILVVGAPGEDNAGLADVGVVHQFHITNTNASLLATTWKSNPVAGDLFGEKVIVVNTNPAAEVSDSTLILAVGSPGENFSSTVVDTGEVRVIPAGKSGTLAYTVQVERRSGSLPGTAASRELIGIAFGANSTHLLVPSVYQGTRAVYAIRWSDLAVGSSPVSATTVAPSGAIGFGAQIS